MRVGEILVAAKEVLEEGNVLTQSSYLLKGFGSVDVNLTRTVRPRFRFQRIDDAVT